MITIRSTQYSKEEIELLMSAFYNLTLSEDFQRYCVHFYSGCSECKINRVCKEIVRVLEYLSIVFLKKQDN